MKIPTTAREEILCVLLNIVGLLWSVHNLYVLLYLEKSISIFNILCVSPLFITSYIERRASKRVAQTEGSNDQSA